MPDVATKSTVQRVVDLEAWAFRTGEDLADIKETLHDLPKIIREEVMTYTAPMFEEIMNRMATKEDLSALSTKVDGLETKVDNLDSKVGNLEMRMNTRMDSLEGRMESMEGRMDSMEGKLDLILTKLG
ncbi:MULTISPECIES: DUF2730 family protein [unclassified Streptosporangium]|uniref:DUF2730 family protein n=1 Tax=unclassified Streptosporangium TaxID=2632669 RepID=UPI002E2CBE52|nr:MULTISPECIES: DUF2730 family protein [unclassified Streptosporangium]